MKKCAAYETIKSLIKYFSPRLLQVRYKRDFSPFPLKSPQSAQFFGFSISFFYKQMV